MSILPFKQISLQVIKIMKTKLKDFSLILITNYYLFEEFNINVKYVKGVFYI